MAGHRVRGEFFDLGPVQLTHALAQGRIAEHLFQSGGELFGLAWRDEFGAAITEHALLPGDALFVPYASPHWVKVAGDGPSISLSLTWQDSWSERTVEALGMNRLLRRAGLTPAALPAWPRVPHLRALAFRLARKAGLA